MSGTVNISRCIWRDTAFKDQPFTEREAFMWLVMEASWRPREKRVGAVVVQLERGQLASSIRFMAEAWGWQKSTVDRFLKRLKNRDMIGTAGGTGINVISICKYNDYQNAPSGSGTPKKSKAGQQRDSSGTNYNKGLIPEAIKERDTNVSLPRKALDRFDDFWAIVPRKVAKGHAKKAWAAAVKIAPPDDIIAGMQRYAKQRKGQDQQYTKHPATWLRAECWNDETQHSQQDFHNEIEKRLGESANGLPSPSENHNVETQYLPAPVSAPDAFGRRGGTDGDSPDRGRHEQSHLSIIKPRRFGGKG